jgi:cytochrome c-type biogenesis protein CcmH/NrfG
VQAHPTDADAWLVTGYVLYFTGRRDDAAVVFRRARSLRPSDPTAAVFLADPQTAPIPDGVRPAPAPNH